MKRAIGMVALCAVLAGAACAEQPEPEAETAEQAPAAAPAAPAEPVSGLDAVDVRLREWAVELSRDSVAAGPLTFRIRNTGSAPHAFEVEGGGAEWATGELAPGAEVSMSLDLAAGDYKVYCPLEAGGSSHESRGMVARLRVR